MALPNIEIRRHYTELSPKDTDELVAAAADLIVTFLKTSRDPDQNATTKLPVTSSEGPIRGKVASDIRKFRRELRDGGYSVE